MIAPADDGAVTVMVKAGPEDAAVDAAMPAASVTVHVSLAEATLRLVQVTEVTPVPAVAAVAVAPVGN